MGAAWPRHSTRRSISVSSCRACHAWNKNASTSPGFLLIGPQPVQLAQELFPLLLRQPQPRGFLQEPNGRRVGERSTQPGWHLLCRGEEILSRAPKDFGQADGGVSGGGWRRALSVRSG